MKKVLLRLPVIVLVAFFFACQTADPLQTPHVLKGNAQGTTFSIKYYGEDIPNSIHDVDSIFQEMDNCFSLWLDNSLLVRWNECDSSQLIVDHNTHMTYLLDRSKEIHEITSKAFDPALHPIISAWGFSRKKGIEPTPQQIARLLEECDFNEVRYSTTKSYGGAEIMALDCFEGSLDFNAIAQGYTVDVLSDYFRSKGIENYFVEVGGETLTKGLKPGNNKWVVSIDKPSGDNFEHVSQDTVYITNKALVTSGNYRKVLEIDGRKYSHTIDPTTGYPVMHQLLSATVIADECADADAFATAFMVMGVEDTKNLVSNSKLVDGVYLIYEEDGEMKTYISEGFKPFLKP